MWFWLAFCSAITGAVEITLNKKVLNKVSATVLTWSLFTLSLPLIAYFAIKNGLPSLNQMFFLGVVASSLTFIFSKTISNETIKNNSVSKVFPLAAFNGFFTYIFGLLFLSESLRLVPVIGLFLTIIGSYILNADQAKEDLLKPLKLLFTNKSYLLFLFAIMLNALTAIFDKIGINNTQPINAAFTLLVEDMIMIVILTAYLFKKEHKKWFKEFKDNFVILLANGLTYGISTLLVFSAFTGGPIALVLGIKRLQIFFVLIFSYLFLRDKPTRYSWIAAIVMSLGTLMIKLG
ncbi:EamA family transporter [candidate division WWE3 bacterium]|uniref:EamA family transporter n=1 Tax=candidate division WWE3 bacterium TaxID=2053526 RepID=A0A7X9E6A7_UNCKA|nr:EamA family transporter [candidate division WWE3 bacterium]